MPPGILERGLILRIRFELDQYINLRPVKLYPGVPSPIVGKGATDVDFVVVRENTEGMYAGAGGFFKKDTPDEVALQTGVNTRKGVERCIRYAFDLARTREREEAHAVHKTNVLTYAGDLWERTFHAVGDDYPDVDARLRARRRMVRPAPCSRPSASTSSSPTTCSATSSPTSRRRCRAGWASRRAATSIQKACRCSSRSAAPLPTSRARDEINPMAAIGALQMMLAHLGEVDAASAVERGMAETFPRLKGMGARGDGILDLGGRRHGRRLRH